MDGTRNCPSCGKPLSPGAPAGVCPQCLLKAGFRTGKPGESGTRERRSAARHRKHFEAPPVAELAPFFPHLEIIELIGQGGMGAVYRAAAALNRTVALKVIPTQVDDEKGFGARFAREARALAQLNHPNIVAVHDFGQSGPYHYFVMEFVDGLNLRQILDSGGIGSKEALAIVPQICDALQFAHDRGVVHRDIKPENILLARSGVVKIADFGLAKLVAGEPENLNITGAGDVMGTPHYMAPEQLERPLEVDHRADIYSVGVVFYQMLTGELPIGRFAAPSKKVQIDVRLDEIVLRALEKEPNLRFQQAGAFKTELETLNTAPAPAKELPAGKRLAGLFGWRAAATLLAVACALLVAYVLANNPRFNPAAAAREVPMTPPASQEEPRPQIQRPVVPATPAPATGTTVVVQAPPASRPSAPDNIPIGAPASFAPTTSAVRIPAVTDFDAMEQNPEILKLYLTAAEDDLNITFARYRLGSTSASEMLMAQSRVGLIQAKLAGDRVLFAKTQLEVAEKRLAEASVRRNAGMTTDRDLLEARTNRDAWQIRVKEAEDQVARAQSAVNEPPSISGYVFLSGEVGRRDPIPIISGKGMTLVTALQKAGGTPKSNLQNVRVVRAGADGAPKELGGFNVAGAMAGRGDEGDIELQPGDQVSVPARSP